MPARGEGYATVRWHTCPVCTTNEWRQRKDGRKVCAECDRQSAKLRKRKARKVPAFRLWESARLRAEQNMTPFTITEEDIRAAWPSNGLCPVFGMPLEAGVGFSHDGSPTLDRLNPAWGYEKGNITVISHKANRAKSGLTAEELERIARWMRVVGLN
jgi:hypothetical protein